MGALRHGYREGRKTDPVTRAVKGANVEFVLWIIAVVLVVSGIVAAVRGEVLWGVVLIIVGLLVGPGGVSVFT